MSGSQARTERRAEEREMQKAIDKSLKNGKQMVEVHQFTEGQMLPLKSMELAIRDIKQAQGAFMAAIATEKLGYAEGTQLAFDVDWRTGKVRMTMVPPKPDTSSPQAEENSGIDT